MRILVIIGFILWHFVLIFWVFIIPFKPLSKLNILLLLSFLGVILVGNILSINVLCELLVSHGISHHTSCVNTLEENGVTKRKHRHVVENAYFLLLFACGPIEFLGEPVLLTVHLINKIPSSYTFGLSPFEKLYGYTTDYTSLRVFGCTYFVIVLM